MDGKLIFSTAIDTSGFKKGVSLMRTTGTKALKAVTTATAATGAAIGAMGAYATKASIEFESAFAGVRKTVEATEEEFKQLEKGIREMSKVMPQSASEIAGVAEAAGQLGIETANILGFTKSMVMLGDATNMTSDEAATALARLANITGMSQMDFDRLGSSIVHLGNNLATTEKEIVDMSLRLAGTASQVGMTEAQILALAGAMSSVGIQAQAGGGSMSRVMQKINTEVLSLGDNLDEFAKISGMTSDDFVKQWSKDPAKAISSFVKGLDRINKGGGDVASTLKSLGISSTQEIDTLLRLSGASDVLVDSLRMSNQAWKDNTALVDEANQRYETTESKIAMLKNRFKDLTISIGDELKGALLGSMDIVVGYTEQISNALSKGGIAEAIRVLGGIFADAFTRLANEAPKMLNIVVGMINSLINGIKSNKAKISKSMSLLVTTFIGAILKIIPNVVSIGVDIMTAIIDGISRESGKLTQLASDAMKTIINSIMKNLPILISAGVTIIQNIIKGLVSAIPMIASAISSVLSALLSALIKLTPQLITLGTIIIREILSGISKALPLLANAALIIIPQLLSAIVSMLPQLVDIGVQIIVTIVNTIVQLAPQILAAGQSIIMSLIDGITRLMPTLINAIATLVPMIIQTIVSMAPAIISAVFNIGMQLLDTMIKLMPAIISAIMEVITMVIQTLAKEAPRIIGAILDMMMIMVSTIYEYLPAILEAVVSIITSIVGAIAERAPEISNVIIDVLMLLIEAIGEFLPELVLAGMNIIMSLISGIVENVDQITAVIVDTMMEIVNIILENLPMLLEMGIQIILALIDGIVEILPELIDTIVDTVIQLADVIIDNLDLIVDAGISLLMALIEGIIDQLPTLIKEVPRIINTFVDTLLGNFDKIIKAGFDIILALIEGLIKAIPEIIKNLPQIIKAILNVLTLYNWVNAAKGIGKDIIKGIINGFKNNLGALRDAVGNIGKIIFNGIKKFFKIKSPSQLMEDQIGKNLTLGIGVGIEDNVPEVLKGIKNKMPKITETMKTAVGINQSKVGGYSSNPSSTKNFVMGTSEEFALAGNVNTVINIDGREIGRTVTPYVSEEIELINKRRR